MVNLRSATSGDSVNYRNKHVGLTGRWPVIAGAVLAANGPDVIPMAFSLWSRRAGGGPALRGGIRAIACKNFF